MKMKFVIQTISLAGLLAFSVITNAAESKPTASLPEPAPSAISQLFCPLKTLYTPRCLLYCIQRPNGKPQICYHDPSVPQCAALNHR